MIQSNTVQRNWRQVLAGPFFQYWLYQLPDFLLQFDRTTTVLLVQMNNGRLQKYVRVRYEMSQHNTELGRKQFILNVPVCPKYCDRH
jgi:hypothetical protein